jgi:hypothetical protein
MVDWFGTPYTEALHLMERYRLLDYEVTMRAVERAAEEHFQFDGLDIDNGPRPDPNYKGKGLQIELTVEDEGAFTTPWSATVTFRRSLDEWLFEVAAMMLSTRCLGPGPGPGAGTRRTGWPGRTVLSA